MPNGKNRRPTYLTPAEVRITYLEYRADEFLDAVSAVAALVALSDGRVEPVERGQLIDFLDRSEFLSTVTPGAVLDEFERCIRDLRTPGGPVLVLKRLARHATSPLAPMLIDAGEEIAAADCRLDPREQRMLQLLRIILSQGSAPSAPRQGRPGARR